MELSALQIVLIFLFHVCAGWAVCWMNFKRIDR